MAVDLEYFGVPPADYREIENRTRLTSAAGQTTFPAPYSVGFVDVYFNGAKLDPFTEFTATDGANIVLSAAGALGDIVEVISRAQVQLANTYTQQQVNTLTSMYYGICTGTGDAQVLVTVPSFTTFSDGMMIRARSAGQNATTAPTFAINGLAAKTVVSNQGQAALYGKDWTANNELTLRYVQSIDKLVLIDGGTTGQTPAQFDNTNQVATTAYVKTAGFQSSGFQYPTTTTTLTASAVGQTIECQGSSNYTITMPAQTAAMIGGHIEFINNSTTAVVTVSANGSDRFVSTGTTGFINLTLNPGDTALVVANGVGFWVLTAGSVQLPYAGVMSGANWTTPAQFDNSTRLATSAFVQRQGVQYSSVTTYSASTTLTATSAGGLVIAYANVASITFTMPASGAFVQGAGISFLNASNYAVVVQRAGADSINPATGTINSITLQPGDTFSVSLFGSVWECTGGSAALAYAGIFGSSVNAPGYQKLPSGIIVQWGSYTTNGTQAGAAVSFPIAFPTGTYSVTVTPTTGALVLGVFDCLASAPTASGFTVVGVQVGSSANNLSSHGGYYIAVGH